MRAVIVALTSILAGFALAAVGIVIAVVIVGLLAVCRTAGAAASALRSTMTGPPAHREQYPRRRSARPSAVLVRR